MPRPITEKKGFIPAANVAQVEMQYTHLGEHCENVYHLLHTGVAPGDSFTNADAIKTAMLAWETNFGAPRRCHNTTFTGLVVRFLDAVDAPVFEFAPAAPIVGTAVMEGSPGNVTVAVKWLTARRGRSFRGRTYHIGLPSEYTLGNQVNAGGQNALKITYGHLITDLATPTGYQLAVVSYQSNKMWRDAALSTVVTQMTLDADLDSQRRRLHGRGK